MILSGLQCVIGDSFWSDETLTSSCKIFPDFFTFIDRAAAKKVAPDRYVGVGRLRYFDPLALCISKLFDSTFSKAVLQPKDPQLVCTARGAAAHYFEITRILLGAEGNFSPLAYANRSLNAIPAQVSQIMGLHGGAFSLMPPPVQPVHLLRTIWRGTYGPQSARHVLLCGGQFPSLHPLCRRVYTEQAESIDLCLTMVIGAPLGDTKTFWEVDWSKTGAQIDPSGTFFCVDIEGNAELRQGGKLLAHWRSNKDVLRLLLHALLSACSFQEPIAIRDSSGLTCLLRCHR